MSGTVLSKPNTSCWGNKQMKIHCLIGDNVVLLFFSFSQLQLKNLHEDLSGRLEESLSIINEKVPFNDTSRYYVQLFIICSFEPLCGSQLIKIISKLFGKKNFIGPTEGCFLLFFWSALALIFHREIFNFFVAFLSFFLLLSLFSFP